MSFVQETVDDLDHALADLRAAAEDEVRQRRALKATLDNLYRLRAYREESTAYYGRADHCDPGKVTEGITFLRGILTHHITKPVAPKARLLFPGPRTFPGPDTFLGGNLTWLEPDDVSTVHPPITKRDMLRFSYYRSHVGGYLVLSTLRTSREFLVNDSQLGPL